MPFLDFTVTLPRIFRAATFFGALALAAPAAGQYVRDYEVGVDDVAREIAKALRVESEASGNGVKFSLIRQARSTDELLCEPLSSKLATNLNEKLTRELSGFRFDTIDSQRLESGRDGAAIAVKWSSEAADGRVQIRAELTRFADLEVIASPSAYVRLDDMPSSDQVCLVSKAVFATCTATQPIPLFDSPVPQRARPLPDRIQPGQPFQVVGHFNLPDETSSRALLLAYEARPEDLGNEAGTRGAEQRRAFTLGGSQLLSVWADSGVCFVTFSDIELAALKPEPPEPQRPRWEPGRPMPVQCPDCPRMTVLPETRFALSRAASDPLDPQRLLDPEDRSELRDVVLAVAETEITLGDWDPCVRAGACRDLRFDDANRGRGEDHPASVSWDDAQTYIAWLNEAARDESRGGSKFAPTYRLPREAEWEYAARGELGAMRGPGERAPAYWWGDVMVPGRAVCRGCERFPGQEAGPAPVSFAAARADRRWNLQDMSGNLWEWTADCWSADGPARPGCPNRERVVKGGSFADGPLALRADARAGAPQSRAHAAIGFRVVADEPAER